jgi:hypothetical protein
MSNNVPFDQTYSGKLRSREQLLARIEAGEVENFFEGQDKTDSFKETKSKMPRTRKRSHNDIIQSDKKKRYRIQESKRAPKIQVDQRFVLRAWLFGIAIAFIASAIVSFNGITSVAAFVGLSQTWMASLFFFFIELMYLLYLIAYLVLGSRIDEEGNPEKTRGAFWGMVSFGGIAVFANAFHTFDFWQFDWTSPQMWAGVVLSIAAPIAIITASKMASRVVFAKSIKL